MKNIDTWMIKFIQDYRLSVLRETKTNKAINVSYSIDGLQWSTTKEGKYVYFDQPKVVNTGYLTHIEGKSTNPNYYVEAFIPRDHFLKDGQIDKRNQSAEFFVIDKAMRLLAPQNLPYTSGSYTLGSVG